MMRRKSVTLNDIAERLNISTAVVSAVLNNPRKGVWVSKATRQSIVDLAKEMGYQSKVKSRSFDLMESPTKNVAILCLPWYDPLFGKTISELCCTLGEWGFHPFIRVSPDKQTSCDAALKLHREGKADAFIMLGARSHANEVEIGAAPCVIIGEAPPEMLMWQVCVNNRHGGRLVGEYLWSLGHRRIGIIKYAEALYSEKQAIGVRSVWEERQAAFPESRLLNLPELIDMRRFAEMLDAFLLELTEQEGEPLTALFCAGDTIAAYAMRAIKERGLRIPEDISIVGFDDAPMSSEFLDPPLTTVRQPFVQLGHVATQLLREHIERPMAEPQQIFLPGELVVRNSCAPPQAG